MIYRTKQYELLDYICWKHYYKSTLLDSVLAQESEYYEPGQEIMDIFNLCTMNGRTDDQMGKIVNKVLEANPGLINHGIFLPSGLDIYLPEIEDIVTAGEIVQLWD